MGAPLGSIKSTLPGGSAIDLHFNRSFRRSLFYPCGPVMTSISGESGTNIPEQLPPGSWQDGKIVDPFNMYSFLAEEVRTGTNVLARVEPGSWLPGTVVGSTRDGERENRFKYTVEVEGLGSHWLSGHHIAFHRGASMSQLFIGAQLVIKTSEASQQPRYSPAMLAELPNRRNMMRFLVFLPDGSSSFVDLPGLRLICNPLQDSWMEETEDPQFKDFIEVFLKAMMPWRSMIPVPMIRAWLWDYFVSRLIN